MRAYVYPYKMGSDSALKIADGLQCLRLKPDSDYHPKPHDLIVNWGCSQEPQWYDKSSVWLNYPEFVKEASNKLTTFEEFRKSGVLHPEWTTNKEEALLWTKKYYVMARKILNGHSGQGIVVSELNANELPDAPLYVKYKKKSAEYRVHVFQDEVIDVQQKKKRLDFDKPIDTKIRSYDNGWVFCRNELEIPNTLYTVALAAVKALGLDFGAVDVVYNKHEDRCYALEVNTAPGLEGETMFSYVIAILNYMETM